jgi:translation initiation factor eIF-2B subunit alpha
VLTRGENFLVLSTRSRAKIAQLGTGFIRDGQTIFVHGFSRVVLSLLLEAAAQGKLFKVIVSSNVS